VPQRLTHTENHSHPGCQAIARSSPDGERLSFRMRDGNSQRQILLIAQKGASRSKPRLRGKASTRTPAGTFPGRESLVLRKNRILVIDIAPSRRLGYCTFLSDRPLTPCALVWSHDRETLAHDRIIETQGKDVIQIFVTNYSNLERTARKSIDE
jgi:hypothetical protein